MIMVGVPYTIPELTRTSSGGTPYGPSHVAGSSSDLPLTDEEKEICTALGKRLTEIAVRLKPLKDRTY